MVLYQKLFCVLSVLGAVEIESYEQTSGSKHRAAIKQRGLSETHVLTQTKTREDTKTAGTARTHHQQISYKYIYMQTVCPSHREMVKQQAVVNWFNARHGTSLHVTAATSGES